MSKVQIRKKVLKLRQNTNNKNKPFQTEKIFKLIKNIEFKKKIIGCYYPVNFEANIINLIKKLQNHNFLVCLPRIHKNNKMNFYEYKKNDLFYVNNFGIPEPINKKKIITKYYFNANCCLW